MKKIVGVRGIPGIITAGFAAGFLIFAVFHLFPARISVITDPVWNALVFTGSAPRRAFILERSLRRTRIDMEEISDFRFEKIGEIVERTASKGYVLSPLLSLHADRLGEAFPDRSFAVYTIKPTAVNEQLSKEKTFEEKSDRKVSAGRIVRLYRDRRGSMYTMGKTAAEYLLEKRNISPENPVKISGLFQARAPGSSAVRDKKYFNAGFEDFLDKKMVDRDVFSFSAIEVFPETTENEIREFLNRHRNEKNRFLLLFGGVKNSMAFETARRDGIEFTGEGFLPFTEARALITPGIQEIQSGDEFNSLVPFFLVEDHLGAAISGVRAVKKGGNYEISVPFSIIRK